MRHCPPTVLKAQKSKTRLLHIFAQAFSAVLNNAHAISLPSLEDLEVDNTSIFSLTRDLITFVIRSSSSLGKEGGGRREEGRREKKRGGGEGRREERKEGGKEGRRREGTRENGGKDSHLRT